VTIGAGKSAIFLSWAEKAGKPLLFSDRETGINF